MDFQINPNGSLTITRDDSEVAELQELLDRAPHKDHSFLADLLGDYTGWEGNGRLHVVRPEWVGALTDAPIVADEVVHNDDGEMPTVPGNVWWFPQYEMRSFAEDLIRNGKVIFTAAPENERQVAGQAQPERARG